MALLDGHRGVLLAEVEEMAQRLDPREAIRAIDAVVMLQSATDELTRAVPDDVVKQFRR